MLLFNVTLYVLHHCNTQWLYSALLLSYNITLHGLLQFYINYIRIVTLLRNVHHCVLPSMDTSACFA